LSVYACNIHHFYMLCIKFMVYCSSLDVRGNGKIYSVVLINKLLPGTDGLCHTIGKTACPSWTVVEHLSRRALLCNDGARPAVESIPVLSWALYHTRNHLSIWQFYSMPYLTLGKTGFPQVTAKLWITLTRLEDKQDEESTPIFKLWFLTLPILHALWRDNI